MKIVLYYPENLDKPRGTRNRVINLATVLADYHDVYVLAYSIYTYKKIPFTFIKLKRVPLIGNLLKYFNAPLLLNVIHKIRPDIIYSFTEVSLPAMTLPSKIYKIPHVVEIQSIVVEDICLKHKLYKENGVVYRILDSLVTWMLKKTDLQVMGCEPLRQYYVGKLHNMILMPPSINTALFNDKVEPDKSLENLKIKTGKILVTYAGNFNYYQGTLFLLDVISKLRKENVLDFIFVFIGNPSEEFKQKMESLHLEKDIVLKGSIPNDAVASYLKSSQILIIPRLDTKITRFAFPSKHLEYMAVGNCIVSTKTWPSEELITHLKNGLLADQTVDDFIHKLLIARDKRLRERMGNNAANLIKKKFAVKNDAIRLNVLFKELIKKSKKIT